MCMPDSFIVVMEQQEQQQEKLPQFGLVEGNLIKLNGLDYSLLATEQPPALSGVMSRLQELSDKLMGQRNKEKKGKAQNIYLDDTNDQLTQKILSCKQLQKTINMDQFYLFDLRYHFGAILPEVYTRRRGKMHSEEVYLQHTPAQQAAFSQLKQNTTQHCVSDENEDEDEDVSESEDDIFAVVPEETKADKIKIGNKLNLGVGQQQIFGERRQGVREREEVVVPEYDKYAFLRKKTHLNEEGYEECYNQVGYSLQEMKLLREQGVKLFEDEHVRSKKEHKVNLNKDYQKIKRIIDSKKT